MESLQFASVARAIGRQAHAQGLVVPAFRSHPRTGGTRSIRRLDAGGAVVAVDLHRDPHAVATDMIDGIVAANHLDATAAETVRARCWEAAGHALEQRGAA